MLEKVTKFGLFCDEMYLGSRGALRFEDQRAGRVCEGSALQREDRDFESEVLYTERSVLGLVGQALR